MRRISCFCAFCKHERKIYSRRHISWQHILLTASFALAAMGAIWQQLDGRVFLIFVLGLLVAELFVSFRWRMSVVCPHCHFDPVLYSKNPEAACKAVKTYLDQYTALDIEKMWRRNPYAHLNVVKKKAPKGLAALRAEALTKRSTELIASSYSGEVLAEGGSNGGA